MAVVADSGGVYGLYDADDRHHRELAQFLRRSREQIILPSPLLGELGYMLNHWLSQAALVRFLEDLSAGVFRLEDVHLADLERAASLLRRYEELNLGLCDATVVAVAERLQCDQILTVDQRHFRVMRRANGQAFRLLPADLDQV